MNMAVAYGRACCGIKSPLVSVEVHLVRGLPRMTIVGLPATAVKESKDRVESAIVNSGFDFPLRRITVNLAPADLPKQGGRFDLPIALGILAASKQIDPALLQAFECIGELALSGKLRPSSGILSFAMAAKKAGHPCIVPIDNGEEAGLVNHPEAYAVKHLLDAVAHIQNKRRLSPIQCQPFTSSNLSELPNMTDVQEQVQARRALEIAAAGGHNLLMIGPPGVGKSMLAERLPSLLPPLSIEHSLEVGAIHSLHQQGLSPDHWQQPPFRSPHHSISTAALIGGGNPPTPGEISLAHRGILFLDELNEFQRSAKEALREPMETGEIHIARSKHSCIFPANFQLVAAINPCPCGYAGDGTDRCRCATVQIERHQARLSGPLLDRIDIRIRLHSFAHHFLIKPKAQEKSEVIRKRAINARKRQEKRQKRLNATLSANSLQQYLRLSDDAKTFITDKSQSLTSPRTIMKRLKVARTIADLDHNSLIETEHLIEAISLQHTINP